MADNGLVRISIDIRTEQARQSVRELRQRVEQEMNPTERIFSRVKNSLIALGGVKFGVSLANDIIKVRTEIQQTESVLGAFLGSTEKGLSKMNEIVEYSKRSIYDINTLSKGATTMLGFGVSEEQIMPAMKQLGNIARGNTESFQGLALAYGQCMATGRLMAQDLLN